MVERIVENLLANAVKHTPGDSRIWVRVERTDEGALIAVEDDGPGVAPERPTSGSSSRSCRGRAPGRGAPASASRSSRSSPSSTTAGRGSRSGSGGGASFRVLLAFEPEPDVLVLPDGPQETGTDSSPEDNQA